VHNIREDVDDVALYNWGFMVLGLVLAAIGWWLLRTKGRIGMPDHVRG
jgi:cbb3-type cytochrome oxidase subunit 3